MSLHLGIMSPLDKHLAELAETREQRNADYLDRKDREAFAQLEPGHVHVPEIIQAGQVTRREHQFTWNYHSDMFEDWRSRAEKRIRHLRQEGKVLTPREVIQFRTHEEKVYHDEVELQAVRDGLFCVRCFNPQPETELEAERLHQRLSDATGYRRPDGCSAKDCCCYCGNRVHTQKDAA